MPTDPAVKVAGSSRLLLRKVAIAFAIGGGAYLIPEVLDILDALRDEQDVEFTETLLVSLAAGTFAGALRAALAWSPFNIAGPTDALHTLGRSKPTTVIVDEDPGSVDVEVTDE